MKDKIHYNMSIPILYLASQSPRRAALLRLMGFSFRVLRPEIKEDNLSASDSVKQVLELSKQKAESVLDRVSGGIVVGADTLVCLDGMILGKPKDALDAISMLTRLSGKTHQVYTGFTIVDVKEKRMFSDYARTDVTFRRLEAWEVEAYADTIHPLDKAGAYGIQDQSGLFVERIDGCFYNVVGFPLTKFYEALKRFWSPDVLQKILKDEK